MYKKLSLCSKLMLSQITTTILLLLAFFAALGISASTQFTPSASLVVSLVIIAIALSFTSSFFTSKLLCHRLAATTTVANSLATGNLTNHMEVRHKDELATLANCLNEISTNMRVMFWDIKSGSESLYFSTNSLLDISGSMTEKSDFTRDKATMVATAAEEMSANMNSVAAAVEQASVNMNVITTAIEELTSTVQEIANNTERAQSITSEAVHKAETTTQNVNQLGDAAYEITKVTEVITEISEQTNLLALNATIEAARAGEAGKGFAVVANEIKELAKQTADATQEIRTKIEGIQSTTDITVKEIGEITTVISNIDETVSGIASAVEEQSVTTQEISSNIIQASEGIQEINENVAQSSAVVGEIASDVALVSKNAVHSAEDGVEIEYAVKEMCDLAGRLRKQVDHVNIGDAKFDIVKIKDGHMKFKENLRKVMKGEKKMLPNEVATEHTCLFGQWFYSTEGKQYEKLPIYRELEKSHAQVHTIGRQIVSAVNDNDHSQTRDMLTRFDEARITLFQQLEQLYSA